MGLIKVWIAMGFGRVFVVHKDQIIHGALVSASPCLYRMLNGFCESPWFCFPVLFGRVLVRHCLWNTALHILVK